ncbi:hypothetical protein [Sebaldella sp. S0638]|uniref:hypothetical protein n=1 Tax=Sebaldella sp. S0638 TaxID=2957809 RepID=UPI00209F1243|nr:hypothetical protein [Sebaldella sp. S0638]MCP1226516.1 hypothetical protein [Sebaldella sp. S0638]
MKMKIIESICYIVTLFFLVNSLKTRKRRMLEIIKKLLIYLTILTALKYSENLSGVVAVLIFIIINNEYLEK